MYVASDHTVVWAGPHLCSGLRVSGFLCSQQVSVPSPCTTLPTNMVAENFHQTLTIIVHRRNANQK